MGLETKNVLDYQGGRGIISIVRWNVRPVISGVDKASSDIMQQQGSKAKTPQKKGAHFFRNPFFDQFFFKNTNFAPPPWKLCTKNLQKPLFL